MINDTLFTIYALSGSVLLMLSGSYHKSHEPKSKSGTLEIVFGMITLILFLLWLYVKA